MNTLTRFVSGIALTLALGCSGGGDDDDGTVMVDAAPQVDAMPLADAMPAGGTEGAACAASQNDPLGGCQTGFVCLSTGGGQSCFRDCTANNQTCASYNGIGGGASCQIGIQDQNMNTIGMACAVVCKDTEGKTGLCSGGDCDGSCPATWTCTNTPNDATIGVCQ